MHWSAGRASWNNWEFVKNILWKWGKTLRWCSLLQLQIWKTMVKIRLSYLEFCSLLAHCRNSTGVSRERSLRNNTMSSIGSPWISWCNWTCTKIIGFPAIFLKSQNCGVSMFKSDSQQQQVCLQGGISGWWPHHWPSLNLKKPQFDIGPFSYLSDLSMYLSNNISIQLSIHPAFNISIQLYQLYKHRYTYIHLSIYPATKISSYILIYQSIYLDVYLSYHIDWTLWACKSW